jgi:hypothetical protein
MFRRHRAVALAAAIGMVAIGGTAARADAATATPTRAVPQSAPVNMAGTPANPVNSWLTPWQEGAAAAQAGWQAGMSAAAYGFQAGLNGWKAGAAAVQQVMAPYVRASIQG